MEKLFGNSLQMFWVKRFIYAALPFIVLIIATNFYAVRNERTQVAKSNRILAQMHVDHIENELYAISANLSGLVMTNPDAAILSTDTKGLNRHFALVRLFNTLRRNAVGYNSSGNFFICDTEQKLYAAVKTGYLSDEVFRPAYSHVGELFLENPDVAAANREWTVFEEEREHFILRAFRNGNCIVGVFLHADALMEKLSVNRYGDQTVSVITTDGFTPLSNNALLLENNIALEQIEDGYAIAGGARSFIIVSEPFSAGPFRLFTLMPDRAVLERQPWLLALTLFIIALMTGLIPYTYISLKKTLFTPLQEIGKAMNRMKAGDLDARIESRTDFAEFRRINDTFNEMGDRIKTLKIDIYEQKLFNNETELDYLRLQINPHFFLNSLNLIYNLCQTKNYRLIRELSLSLVKYFRYLNRHNLRLMSLGDELAHARNYLFIQELRFPGRFSYVIDCPEALNGYLVPTLLLQTFIENAIQHGAGTEKLTLKIIASLDESACAPRLIISIEDSGKGFDEQTLKTIRAAQPVIKEDGQHIGIWNAVRRVSLLYGEDGSLEFGGAPGGRVKLSIPAAKKESPNVSITDS